MLDPERQEVDVEGETVETYIESADEQAAREYLSELPEGQPEVPDEYVQAYNEYLHKNPALTFDQYEADCIAWQKEEQEQAAEYEQKIYPILLASTLFKRPQMPVQSYCPDFIYAGGLTTITGAPKAGKSTLLWYVLNAITKGEKVFDAQCRQGKVLYISEQNEACFRDQAQNVPSLAENPDLGILLAEHNRVPVPGKPEEFHYIANWESQLTLWQERIKVFDADVVVIDTLGAYFHLPPGGENDNGLMQQRMAQLRLLFNLKKHMAIVLVHHNRKESTNPNQQVKEETLYPSLESIRGASAIAGAVDHAICVGAPKDIKDSNRYLAFFGRYVESNGLQMQVELDRTTQEYKKVAVARPYDSKESYVSASQRVFEKNKKKVLDVLPRTAEKAKSMSELEHYTGLHNRTIKEVLRNLNVQLKGRGVRNDPVFYWLNETMYPVVKEIRVAAKDTTLDSE